MTELLKYIYPILKNIVEVSSLTAKFFLGIGLILITCYFMYIDYFPKDLAVGDGLIFILITAKFTIIVFIFLFANYTIGKLFQNIFFLVKCFFGFIIQPIEKSKLIFNIVKKPKKLVKSIFSIEGFIKDFLFTMFSLMSIIIFAGFYSDFFSIDLKNTISNIVIIIGSCSMITIIFDSIVKDFKSEDDNKNENITLKLSMLICIVILNIFTYHSSKQNRFLFFSSSLVREQNNKKVTIYVKKEYKDFFPEKDLNAVKGDYIPINNVEILLKGIGKNALLQYQVKSINKETKLKKIEIPNDALLIEKD
ncbi:hypothetical protein [Acinetobacter pollinis]|uniref:RDD domain-containing protein n=1 Tax=Acinetobacter pollinis TaxID=2605270 RepID=A0ABU6DQJ7_9GAMM|nr:hypothetical protein [Acinetobacter pollinis]MEB5475990.1 hypothetical protein [Acinetobacter pollinis]